jgi:hypothetical protein
MATLKTLQLKDDMLEVKLNGTENLQMILKTMLKVIFST